jgi:hypothetical protein
MCFILGFDLSFSTHPCRVYATTTESNVKSKVPKAQHGGLAGTQTQNLSVSASHGLKNSNSKLVEATLAPKASIVKRGRPDGKSRSYAEAQRVGSQRLMSVCTLYCCDWDVKC